MRCDMVFVVSCAVISLRGCGMAWVSFCAGASVQHAFAAARASISVKNDEGPNPSLVHPGTANAGDPPEPNNWLNGE